VIDWQHLFEAFGGSAVGVLFGCGVSYGYIKAKLEDIAKSCDRAHDENTRAHSRIDDILLEIHR